MNYAYFLTTLAGMLQYQDTNDPNFLQILPALINDGEGRIYRELDFLATRTVNASLSLTANSRTLDITPLLSLASGPLLSVQAVNVISPGSTAPAVGKRNRLRMVTKDVLDILWPVEEGPSTTNALPRYGAMQDNVTLLVAPTPDAAYVAEIGGIYRPAPLTGSNPTTYLSETYPDLLIAACMVFSTGYQRDFGAMADDPKMAVSWESHYQTLKQSAVEEEKRRKGESIGGSPTAPPPVTTPAQG